MIKPCAPEEKAARYVTPSSRIALKKFAEAQKQELRRKVQQERHRNARSLPALSGSALERRLHEEGTAGSSLSDDEDGKPDLVSQSVSEHLTKREINREST